MSNVVNDFNKTMIDLVEQLSLVVPNTVISNNLPNLKMIIISQPSKVIELFCVYVLQEKELFETDFNQFINKSYDDKANGNNEIIGKIFELRNIWQKLSIQNQQLVQQYISCLFYYAQEYFI
jgi:hypothetical protein